MMIPKEVHERFDRQDREAAQGLVRCDSFCGALEEPQSLDEFRATLEHYRDHGYLNGCSHGGI